jgi:ABC-type nitrate/sulfonate/bicarbonate transport system permease component
MAVQQHSKRGRRETSDWARAVAAVRSVPNTVRIVAVIAFFIFWHFSARDANQLFLVGPIEVFWAGVDIFQSGAMGNAFAESMEHFFIGLGISVFGGIAIGVMMGQWWYFEYTMDPFVNAFYAMPRIAFIPLFIMCSALRPRSRW